MQPDDTTLSWLFSEKGQIALAGAAGGLVRWMTLREDWRSGFISVLVGLLCATYLASWVFPILEPIIGKIATRTDGTASAGGFLIGIGGVAVVGFVIDVWKARRRSARNLEPTDGEPNDG